MGDRSGGDARRARPGITRPLAEQARHDIGEIQPLLEEVLDASLLARIIEEVSSSELRSDDELWVRTVYAVRRGRTTGTDQHRAPGRPVRSAVPVACRGVHGTRRAPDGRGGAGKDSSRCVRRFCG